MYSLWMTLYKRIIFIAARSLRVRCVTAIIHIRKTQDRILITFIVMLSVKQNENKKTKKLIILNELFGVAAYSFIKCQRLKRYVTILLLLFKRKAFFFIFY